MNKKLLILVDSLIGQDLFDRMCELEGQEFKDNILRD